MDSSFYIGKILFCFVLRFVLSYIMFSQFTENSPIFSKVYECFTFERSQIDTFFFFGESHLYTRPYLNTQPL